MRSLLGSLSDIAPEEFDRALGRFDQTEGETAEGRFARSGFTDQREGFGSADFDGDAVQGMHLAGFEDSLAGCEDDGGVFDPDHWRSHDAASTNAKSRSDWKGRPPVVALVGGVNVGDG